MSGITPYANQTATLKRRTGYASATGATTTSSTITCRYEPYTRQMQNAVGEMFVSNARIFTASAVAMGDIIVYDSQEFPVKRVMAHPGFDGTIDHYEVVL